MRVRANKDYILEGKGKDYERKHIENEKEQRVGQTKWDNIKVSVGDKQMKSTAADSLVRDINKEFVHEMERTTLNKDVNRGLGEKIVRRIAE